MNGVRYANLALGVALLILSGVNAFTCHTPATATGYHAQGHVMLTGRSLARNNYQRRGIVTIVKNSEQDTTTSTNDPQDTADTTTASSTPTSGAKESLEEKMKKWDATEEEIKKASLGGVVPGRVDGFDLGLYIMFPIIVLTSLFFGIFPFIMDKIDVSSVGPPPMV